MKLYLLSISSAFMIPNLLCGQGLGLPDPATAEQQLRDKGYIADGTRPDDIVFEETDFDAPTPGQVMNADWKRLQSINQTVAGLLSSSTLR